MTSDYPAPLPPVNHTAPVPRRIRAFLNGRVVLDTMSALYVWEWSRYPQYYVPVDDIDPAVLVDEQHEQKLSRGTARRYALRVGDTVRAAALRVYGDNATVEGLAGRARFEWDSVDAWFEEDEQVFVHPRDPYVRVDALRSTRPVRVELDGVTLAESSSPVLVFETGLPTRYYLNRSDVDVTKLFDDRHGDRVPLQRCHQRLLERPSRRHHLRRRRLDLRLPNPTAAPHCRPHRVLQREG